MTKHRNEKMTINDKLELEIPRGYWCDNEFKCPYIEIREHRHFCILMAEYNNATKQCGINETLRA